MTDIHYLKGDATKPVGEGIKMIVHVCNDQGGWGSGFVLAIDKEFGKIMGKMYKEVLHKIPPEERLGHVMFEWVSTHPNTAVASMIAQHGYAGQTWATYPYIRYPALRQCLEEVAEEAHKCGATIHMPRIGCGLAGGDWGRVESIIKKTLCKEGLEVFVYDLPRRKEWKP